MQRQEITVVIELKPGQEPYPMVEQRKQGPYDALKDFFEAIEYKVLSTRLGSIR